jgi:hypothetical protein
MTFPASKQIGAAIVVLAALSLVPLSANADPPRHGNGGGGHPAAHAAAHGGGGRSAAPRAAAPRAAPHISAQRAAPHFSAQRAAPHVSAQRAFRGRDNATRTRAAVHNNNVGAHRRANIGAHQRAADRRNSTTFNRAAATARHNRATAAAQHNRAARAAQQNATTGNAALQNARTRRAARENARRNRAVNAAQVRNAAQRRNQAANAARQNRALTAAQQRRLARVNAAQARQGRFASRLYADNWRQHHNVAYRPARWAWRHHRYAGFVGWYGPLFWPYAYTDIFDYAFWPGGYEPGYWDYAYDDFFDGIYYGDAGYVPGYAYAEEPSGRSAPVRAARARASTVAQLCRQPGDGVTAFPFDRISSTVKLTGDQKPLFDDFKTSARDAAKTFAAACPSGEMFARTPPGRLDMMIARLQATDEAVQTVKPALDKFYASLNDEQKERFNELGPQGNIAVASRQAPETTGSVSSDDTSAACGDAKPGLTNLPIERIKDAVNPTDDQQAGLKDLQAANDQAVQKLQAACPQQTPLTPPGRLNAMDQHLNAMIDAANTVKPALDKFYASLSDEQKARFDRLGRNLAQNNDD